MVRANKPLPAELLTGPIPRRAPSPTERADLSRLPPQSRLRVFELLRQLDGSEPPQTDPPPFTADLSRLALPIRESVIELLAQLADGNPVALRLIAAPRPSAEFLATFVMSPTGIVVECDATRDEFLIRPGAEQVDAHLAELLPEVEATRVMDRIRATLAGHAEVAPTRCHLVSQLGQMTWYENRYRRHFDRVCIDVYRLPSVLDRLA